MKFLLSFLIALFTFTLSAQSGHEHRMEADSKYNEKKYTAAEESYRKSLIEEPSVNGTFNLGNSIYNQERYEEAINQYIEAADKASNKNIKADAYHNLGNAYFQNQDFKNSIEAYKNALRNNPTDTGTKQNLAVAQRKLVQQQQQQQQQQNDDQDKDEKDKEQQDQQQQQEQEQEEQKEENQEAQSSEEEPEEEPKDLEEKDLSKEEARKLLQIMESEEQKVQEKMRKGDRKKTKSKKDW